MAQSSSFVEREIRELVESHWPRCGSDLASHRCRRLILYSGLRGPRAAGTRSGQILTSLALAREEIVGSDGDFCPNNDGIATRAWVTSPGRLHWGFARQSNYSPSAVGAHPERRPDDVLKLSVRVKKPMLRSL